MAADRANQRTEWTEWTEWTKCTKRKNKAGRPCREPSRAAPARTGDACDNFPLPPTRFVRTP
jgi:hypothetical protein